MSSSSAHEQILGIRDLPLQTATIFSDRAELKRVFDVTLRQGLNNIIVDNVCDSIEQDSIRVDGKGAAIVHEVQYKIEHSTNAEIDTPQIKELVKQLEEVQGKKDDTENLIKVYNDRMKCINNILENLGQMPIDNKNEAKTLIKFDVEAEQNLENFYSYHERKAVELNTKFRQASKEVKELNQQIDKLNSQLNNLRSVFPIKRSIRIALETTEEETKTQIELTYQAFGASWTPSYDIRVSTQEKHPQLKLIYYGNLKQTTGEDWNDAQIVLSTAKPRMGGQLPQIGTLQAQFRRIQPAFRMAKKTTYTNSLFGGTVSNSGSFGGAPAPAAYDADEAESAENRQAFSAVMPMMALKTADYQAQSHVLSTTFTVPQKKTVPSDGSEHKVTIATLNLTPVLHFDCVPSKNTNVYLTASMINSSNYPLLAGSASVYVDNSFSAKIHLKAIASGEKFDCSLGFDPTIKLQYKPVHKYQQQTGVLTKSSVEMNEQKIIIKNTKQEEPIVLTFVEHVPKSTDEKIKIKLYSPDIKPPPSNSGQPTTNEELLKLKTPEPGAHLNNSHNLEWTVVLSPQEEKEFVIKWGVEFPPVETIEYVERF